MEWVTLNTGRLKPRKGRGTLAVRALTQRGRQVMDLKSVVLKGID